MLAAGRDFAAELLPGAREYGGLEVDQAKRMKELERVQIGHKTVYRARFAGFDKAGAESACKQLKRSAFECIALRN